ncbi:MAG: DUF3955 domain-containing protein [Aquiluna sp.]
MNSKLLRSINLLGTLSLLAAVGLGAYYLLAGSSVDETGLLVEEFWALGLAWIFFFSAMSSAMVSAVLMVRSRRK